MQSLMSKGTSRGGMAHRQEAVTQPISKASISSFAYQGTNAHCIFGKSSQEVQDISAPLMPFERKRFWFQVILILIHSQLFQHHFYQTQNSTLIIISPSLEILVS